MLANLPCNYAADSIALTYMRGKDRLSFARLQRGRSRGQPSYRDQEARRARRSDCGVVVLRDRADGVHGTTMVSELRGGATHRINAEVVSVEDTGNRAADGPPSHPAEGPTHHRYRYSALREFRDPRFALGCAPRRHA